MYKIIIFSAVIFTSILHNCLSNECLTESKEPKKIEALLVQRIKLDHSDSVKYTWQASRGTTNIRIWTSDDVNLEKNEISRGELNLMARSSKDSGGDISTKWCVGLLLLSSLLCGIVVDGQNKWQLVFLLAFSSLLVLGNKQDSDGCQQTSAIHLQIPTNLVKELCVGDNECLPLLCPLSLNSEYSQIPSNNRILFSDDRCSIKKPKFWDEWYAHYFGNDSTPDYFGDADGDGLVNVLEYYGPEAFKDNFVTIQNDNDAQTENGEGNQGNNGTESEGRKKRSSRQKRQNLLASTLEEVLSRGTNPLEADSDGDLIPDGRERLYNTDPRVPDPIDADDDVDGLNNLEEQIHNTDPKNGDSDGDGTKDGDEVNQGSNPRNPRDEGKPKEEQDCDQTVQIKITVGDHSGSHSERYVFHLGNDISHQSPGYGLVGSGTYTLETGTYRGWIQHIGTNLDAPDYDYTALLEVVGGNAQTTISDPQGILGRHGESNPFYARGKSVTVTVELDCEADSTDPCCVCAKITTCRECRASTDPDCWWNEERKKCEVEGVFDFDFYQCPCDQCQAWYNEEIRDTAWKDAVNRELPCPCRVTVTPDGVNADQDDPSGRNVEWNRDSSCTANDDACDEYHPGAFGCIRSDDSDNIGDAGQQCCYNSGGDVLRPPHPGAGTPDKQKGVWHNVYDHIQDDVRPYNWCCLQCEEPDTYCPLYRGVDGARSGDTSHCP